MQRMTLTLARGPELIDERLHTDRPAFKRDGLRAELTRNLPEIVKRNKLLFQAYGAIYVRFFSGWCKKRKYRLVLRGHSGRLPQQIITQRQPLRPAKQKPNSHQHQAAIFDQFMADDDFAAAAATIG